MTDPRTDQSPGLVRNSVVLTRLRQQNLPVLVLLVNSPVPSSNVEILRSGNKETGNLPKAKREN